MVKGTASKASSGTTSGTAARHNKIKWFEDSKLIKVMGVMGQEIEDWNHGQFSTKQMPQQSLPATDKRQVAYDKVMNDLGVDQEVRNYFAVSGPPPPKEADHHYGLPPVRAPGQAHMLTQILVLIRLHELDGSKHKHETGS